MNFLVVSLLVGLRSLPAMRLKLDIVVESGHLELLLQKLAWVDVVDADRASKRAVEGLRIGILSSLDHFSHFDIDLLTMVRDHYSSNFSSKSQLFSLSDDTASLIS